MNESLYKALLRHVRAWDRRLRLAQSTRWLPRGLMAGIVIALILAVVARFRPLLTLQELIIVSASLAGAGLLLTVGVVWLWKRQPLHAARRFDLDFGLRERVSTALEITGGQLPVESEVIADEQVQEAMAFAATVDPSEHIAVRTDWREWGGAGLLSVALVAALLIPNPQQDILAEQAAVDEAIAEEIEDLVELQERIEADDSLTAEEIAALSEVLDETIETLEQSGISQEEALAALDEAEREFADLSEEFAAQRQQALEEASQNFDGTPAEEAGDALEEGDTQSAADALRDIDPSSLSDQERADLADALEQAAEDLAESNPDLSESLQEAADALREGDNEAAEQALDEAAEQMEAEGGEAPNVEQVEEYADELDRSQGDVSSAGSGGGAGGSGANQPGEGGMGQASGAQGQSGEGEGEGQAPGGGGSGRGEGEGEAVGGPQQGDMGTNNGPGDGGEVEYDGVYDPQRVGGEGGEQVDVPGDPGAGAPTGTEGDFVDNPEGDSTVSYDEVFPDYEGAVNEALDNEYVPLGLRDLIHDYFSSLDPDN